MINRESKSEIAAAALAVNTKPPSQTGEHPVCTHCGTAGHEESGCYDIIGYPLHWSNRGRGCGERGSRGGGGERWSSAGSTCGGCTGRREYVATTVTPADLAAGRDGTQAAAPFFPGLTNDQVQRLLSFIEVPKRGEKWSGNPKPPWLLDSGASTHMTGETNLLTSIENINPVIIDFPNGEKTGADKQGTVTLGKGLKLHKTLFVPSLRCNLISVSRICEDLNCTVTFDKNSCIV